VIVGVFLSETGAFELQRVLDMDPDFLNEESEHQHDQTVSSVGFKFVVRESTRDRNLGQAHIV
jgi:hypothetical protein